MAFIPTQVPESAIQIGGETVMINALHGVMELHLGEGVPAYRDRDDRVRISSFALLRTPYAVHDELLRLGRGAWTRSEIATAVARGHHYVVDALRRVSPRRRSPSRTC